MSCLILANVAETGLQRDQADALSDLSDGGCETPPRETKCCSGMITVNGTPPKQLLQIHFVLWAGYFGGLLAKLTEATRPVSALMAPKGGCANGCFNQGCNKLTRPC